MQAMPVSGQITFKTATSLRWSWTSSANIFERHGSVVILRLWPECKRYCQGHNVPITLTNLRGPFALKDMADRCVTLVKTRLMPKCEG
mmetsp:Transcript_32839/g.59603  ORF Transcript_32839/g.59603 Transcript_32839/m.59603 type:complete len:88 (+) Transcript_32839:145-408(+)